MKYCINCGKLIVDNGNYCSACGAAQITEKVDLLKRTKNLPGIITTLGVITLLGSAFGILRGLFYQVVSNIFQHVHVIHNEDYFRGYILVFLNIGTFVSGILIFKLNKIGFFLYLFFQTAYLLFTFYITSFYTNSSEKITDGIP